MGEGRGKEREGEKVWGRGEGGKWKERGCGGGEGRGMREGVGEGEERGEGGEREGRGGKGGESGGEERENKVDHME